MTVVTDLSAVAITPLVVNTRLSQETTEKEKQAPSKAVIKSKPQPHYPKKAREEKIEATIVLRAIFRASGAVTDIKFDEVVPGDVSEDLVKFFTEESIKAPRQIKFTPAMKDGHPISMYMQLEYNFRLD